MTGVAERYDSATPEADIAKDLVRRSVWIAPALIAGSAIGWGFDGAFSAAVGVAIVVGNFLFSAALLTWGARISVGFVLGMAMFGYVIRLGIITVAVLLIKDLAWVELIPLGFTLIITHLGLLLWETKYVSASLAFPGLKPTTDLDTTSKE